jgi:hypothetical protein
MTDLAGSLEACAELVRDTLLLAPEHIDVRRPLRATEQSLRERAP